MSNSWRNQMAGAERLFSLIHPGTRLAVFDTETTGLGPKSARIIQFSGILYEIQGDLGFTEKDRIDVYINPECHIPEAVTEINHISDKTVRMAKPMRERFPELARFLRDCDVWAGQNLQFDIRMVMAEARRLDMYLMEKPVIELLNMSRDWLRKGEDVEDYKLGTVFSYVFPDRALDEEMKFHDSLVDVQATAVLIRHFSRKYYRLLNGIRPEQAGTRVELDRAYVFVNEHKTAQQRIALALKGHESRGDIFYDIMDKQWSCKATKAARELFAEVDMEDLENQVLRKYSRYSSMDDLARNWISYWWSKHPEVRQKAAERRKASRE